MSVFDIRRFYDDADFDRNGVEITVPHSKYKIKKRIWSCETQIEMWEQIDDWKNALYLTGKVGLSSRSIHPNLLPEIYITNPVLNCIVEISTLQQATTFADMLTVLTTKLEEEQSMLTQKLKNEQSESLDFP